MRIVLIICTFFNIKNKFFFRVREKKGCFIIIRIVYVTYTTYLLVFSCVV
jgi:hypothetical protein